jgi:hypothetical protein
MLLRHSEYYNEGYIAFQCIVEPNLSVPLPPDCTRPLTDFNFSFETCQLASIPGALSQRRAQIQNITGLRNALLLIQPVKEEYL